MKFKKLLALGAALVFSVAFIAGCGSNNSDNGAKKELSYSKSQGPYSELFEKGVKPILEKQGYTFKGVDMSDLVQADQVLSDGEVDFNVEQHTAYMKNFNEKQKGHLVALTPIPTVPAGIFSGSKTSLDQVADGDTIAVPNDASNMARAIGAGGVGDLALTYGYERLNFPLMLFTVVILIIFVQIIQTIGNYFARRARRS